jgi:hypothetical protein
MERIAMDKKLKVKRSYTLTDEADELIEKIALKNGISKSAVLEIIIRESAKNYGVATATVAPA